VRSRCGMLAPKEMEKEDGVSVWVFITIRRTWGKSDTDENWEGRGREELGRRRRSDIFAIRAGYMRDYVCRAGSATSRGVFLAPSN
jgi:hypothetical protein